MYHKDLSVHINTRITEEQYATLLELARSSGLTISAVLQNIIDSYTVRLKEMKTVDNT